MTSRAGDPPSSRFPTSILLWTAILLGPLVFTVAFVADYASVHALCGKELSPLRIATIVAVALCVLGGVYCAFAFSSAGRIPEDQLEPASQVRFLSGVGILMNALVGFVFAEMLFAEFLFEACQR